MAQATNLGAAGESTIDSKPSIKACTVLRSLIETVAMSATGLITNNKIKKYKWILGRQIFLCKTSIINYS